MDPETKPGGNQEQSFQPQQFEDDIYRFWEKNGFFKPDESSTARPFCIIKPPPNVTGALHMGHALTDTIEDAVVRYKRMKGFKTLFIPGTDHAGIATQIVVERELAKTGATRTELGREKFLEKVWEVKACHHQIITQQMKKMGGSLDWDRECFTLDPPVGEAVKKVFCQLYREGLLYRGQRLIAWCPKDQTALSDLEVEPFETQGKLWSVRYPLVVDAKKFLVVATTRPETIFADQAIAVHPDDTRYQKWIGKKVRVPGTQREVPVIADAYVDPKFGSGALKVTPGHDFNDYDIGQRHQLPAMMVIDSVGRMTAECGPFQGQTVQECRKNFLVWLEEQGLVEEVKDHVHHVGRCQRCHTGVEPLLSTQWFVRIRPLAEPAIEAVKTGRITFAPEHWTKTYFEWMENIRDWCVSRQLWWGHPIPAFYCDDCEHVMVSEAVVTVCEKCHSRRVRQDPDVLDTWFSSALWPLVTLGWPKTTSDFKTYYPNQLMETGFDIIFFWVARMIMFGLKFGGDIPFEKVFFHAMVRDEHGHKMSKTRGNVIDPLDVIEKYGADALRFTLASMAGQGRDVKLSLERVSGYRNFMNKIWNARRFLAINTAHESDVQVTPFEDLHWVNRWIVSELSLLIQRMDNAYDQIDLTEAATALYNFFWHEYCDWYLELSKVLYQDSKLKNQSLGTGYVVFRETLKLLHPLTPFITEKLFQELPTSLRDADALIVSDFPTTHPSQQDRHADQKVRGLKDIIGTVRRLRSLAGIPPSAKVAVTVQMNETADVVNEWTAFINLLTRASSTAFGEPPVSPQLLKGVLSSGGMVFVDPLGSVDAAKELVRVKKDLDFVQKGKKALEQKLANAQFVKNAPPEVVQAEQEKLSELASKHALLQEIIRTFEHISLE